MVDPLLRTVRPFKWKRSRKPLSLEIRNTYRVLMGALLFLGIATTSSYLYMNSRAPARGYELKELQTNYESLQSDLRKLDRQVVEAQSFINLEQNTVIRKMHVAENHDLSYVEGGSLAENPDTPSRAND